jgi:hypothetical protein
MSFREATNGQVLNNFTGPQFDFFKIMIVAHLILYIPMQFVVMRYSLAYRIWDIKSEDMSLWTHILFTIFLLSLMTGLVLLLIANSRATGETFAKLIDIVGGVAGWY